MNKRLILILVIAAAIMPSVAFANCGPGGIFKDNDYCVSCPGTKFKENSCPGGEAGRVSLGVQHPNCEISFYDNTCQTNAVLSKKLIIDLEKKGNYAPQFQAKAK